MEICIDGAHNLRVAILETAMRDYKTALRSKMTGCYSRYSVDAMEHWFLSPYGQWLSEEHGQDIIDRCQRDMGYREGTTHLDISVDVFCRPDVLQSIISSINQKLNDLDGVTAVTIKEVRANG